MRIYRRIELDEMVKVLIFGRTIYAQVDNCAIVRGIVFTWKRVDELKIFLILGIPFLSWVDKTLFIRGSYARA